MLKTANKSAQNNDHTFHCNICDYTCSKNSDYGRHLMTAKHIKANNANSGDIHKYICSFCSHIFKHASSLSRHKKKCKSIEETTTNETEYKMLTALMLEMVKSNSELQKQMLEVCKINTTTINNNSNSHNKTFNMQIFLNEKCKDAMNLGDFINSMTLELSDLEEVGKLGYVEGISNIIIRKLNALDIYNRPIHCSDGKREIMFVKDDNIWAKENSSYDKLRRAIKSVTYKNSALLGPWSQKYPNCLNNQHHLNDVYVQMLGQAMGGKESFLESENKIMKKIAKAVLIEKSTL